MLGREPDLARTSERNRKPRKRRRQNQRSAGKGRARPPVRQLAAVSKSRILVADEDPAIRDLLRGLLEPRYETETVADGEAALQQIKSRRPDLVIAHTDIPRLNGLELLRTLRQDPATARLPVLLMSSNAAEDSKIQGFESWADDFLVRPFSNRELLARINSNLNLARARQEDARALSESEGRLTFALQAGGMGYWQLDLKSGELVTSDIYKRNWGRKADEPFPYATLLASIHPADLDAHERAVREAIKDGRTLDIEYRAIWPDGSEHWLRVRGHAAFEHGEPVSMAGISLDITDRKYIETSLREETRTLETLNRLGQALTGNLDLEGVVQTVIDAATELSGAQFGSFFYNVINDKGESYTLHTLSGAPREAFSKFPMPRNTKVFDPTFRGAAIVRSDDIREDPRYAQNPPYYGLPKGHLPVVSYLAVPVISRSGDVLGGLFFGPERPGVFTERVERLVAGIAAQASIAIDNARLFRALQAELAERKKVEEQQKLLLAELNHRVRNTLAIVQSIASQTLRHMETAESFRSGFEARIMALADAHNLLTESNWVGAHVRDVVGCVLNPYVGEDASRCVSEPSPDIRVGPNTAVSLVMALHELATNAAKYGALSSPAGRVIVGWELIRENGAARRLRVHWIESGGPEVKQPTRRGFGSRLLRGLAADAGGEARVDFAPAGLVATFDLPFPMVGT
jgi:two-component sensor histidine kinase/DNA-binding response OmpR family regulator